MALEASSTAFDLMEDGLMYLKVSFNSVIPKVIHDGYDNSMDKKGKECFKNISLRLNKTVEGFKKEMAEIGKDKLMLSVYMKNPQLFRKRATGSAIAIALGIFDLVATGASYFYTDYRLRLLQEKVLEVDETINQMNTDNDILKVNQDYLFKEGKTLGVHENVLAEHFNKLSELHSCDVFHLEMKSELSAIESKLNRLKKALLRNDFNSDVLSVKKIQKLTALNEFRDTIYLLAPFRLYDLAKLSLHSVDDNGLTFLVVYPKIGRSPKFKVVSVLETNRNLLIPRSGTNLYFRFLIPFNSALNETASYSGVIRDANSCYNLNGYLACHPYSILPAQTVDCLYALFNGTDGFCFGMAKKRKLSFAFGKKGVLIETRGKAEIMESHSGKILRSLDGHTCTYAEKHQDISVRFGNVVTPVFKQPLMVDSKHVFSARTLRFKTPEVKNFTLPEIQNPFSFRNLTQHHSKTIFSYLENPWVSGTIMVCFISTAVIFSLLVFCFSRCGTANGGTNVRVDMNAIDGGAIGR